MMTRMKKSCPTIVVLSIMFAMSLPSLAADDSGYALLLQASPSEGGVISPGNGVHKVQLGDEVKVAATARPGYRFLYWIGDVGQSGAAETSVRVDSPKLVVAVFERDRFESLPDVGAIGGAANQSSSGNSGLIRSPQRSQDAVSFSSYSPIYEVKSYNSSSNGEEEGEGNEILVPGDDGEEEVTTPEVPEPTTILLLGMGVASMARMRTKKH